MSRRAACGALRSGSFRLLPREHHRRGRPAGADRHGDPDAPRAASGGGCRAGGGGGGRCAVRLGVPLRLPALVGDGAERGDGGHLRPRRPGRPAHALCAAAVGRREHRRDEPALRTPDHRVRGPPAASGRRAPECRRPCREPGRGFPGRLRPLHARLRRRARPAGPGAGGPRTLRDPPGVPRHPYLRPVAEAPVRPPPHALGRRPQPGAGRARPLLRELQGEGAVRPAAPGRDRGHGRPRHPLFLRPRRQPRPDPARWRNHRRRLRADRDRAGAAAHRVLLGR